MVADTNYAKVFVYRYGGTVEANGDVKIRQQNVNI